MTSITLDPAFRRDVVLRTDEAPCGCFITLIELHDDTLDESDTPAWALVVTAPDGEVRSHYRLLLSLGEVLEAYRRELDRLEVPA